MKKWSFVISAASMFFLISFASAGEMALITSPTGRCSEKSFSSKTTQLVGDGDVIEMIDRGTKKGAVRYKIKRLRIINGTAYPMVWENGKKKGKCVHEYSTAPFVDEQIATLLNSGEKVDKGAFTALWGRTEFWLINK